MDTTKAITHVSLCAGYGGIDLGLKRAIPNLRTVAFAEIEAFACANLVAKMEAGQLDPAPIWSDLKTFPWSSFRGKVGILSGGYPCQPFSAAGKRLGADDPRHLWPFIAAGIAAMRPAVCFFENVEGHISLGLEDVLRDLQGLGYRCTFGIFSASEVGSVHQRKRIFLLAHRDGARLEGIKRGILLQQGREEPSGSAAKRSGHGTRGAVADAVCDGGGEGRVVQQGPDGAVAFRDGQSWGDVWPARPGQPQFAWEPPRVVGDAKSERSATLGSEYARQRGELCSASSSCSLHAIVGDASIRQDDRREPRDLGQAQCSGPSGNDAIDCTSEDICDPKCSRLDGPARKRLHRERRPPIIFTPRCELRSKRQTQPALGRDADGPAGGMDYAELCVSGDSRVDELRLLGNGVVPATAERAFNVLASRLFS